MTRRRIVLELASNTTETHCRSCAYLDFYDAKKCDVFGLLDPPALRSYSCRAVRGSTLCQRCERKAWHGPVQRFDCVECRDTGRIDMGGCDIPGCRHFRFCVCPIGRKDLAETNARMLGRDG